jgi:hypothetical protein
VTRRPRTICRRHAEELSARLPAKSFPGVRRLLVVGATKPTLYDYLVRNFAGIPDVKVIMDRRQGERRPERHAGGEERRLREGERSALGYTVVRFGAAPPVDTLKL